MTKFKFNLSKWFALIVLSLLLVVFIPPVFIKGVNPFEVGFFCDGALPQEPPIYNYSKTVSISQKEIVCGGTIIHYVYLTKYSKFFNSEKLIFRFTEEWDMNDKIYGSKGLDDLGLWTNWEGDNTLIIKKIKTYEITVKQYFFENIRIEYTDDN